MLLPASIPVYVGAGVGAALVALALAVVVQRGWRRRLEARLAAEVSQGKYYRALQHYLQNEMWVEAASVEVKRGNPDKAARLFERAGEMSQAAEVYMAAGEPGMAALLFRDAGQLEDAADAFAREGRRDAAAELYERTGQHEEAAEQWRLFGDMDRARAALERAGAGAQAAQRLARWAEEAGQFGVAAEHWARAGELERARELARRSGDPAVLASVLEARGELNEAAALRMRSSEFHAAAELYLRMGKQKEAARALWRAGDVGRATELLEGLGDWLTAARLHLRHGKKAEAEEALTRVTADSPDYPTALQLLASVYEESRRTEDAYRVYDTIVLHAIATGSVGPETRRSIVRMAEILYRAEHPAEAAEQLRRLQDLGLMTPELQTRVQALAQPPGATRYSTGQFRALSSVLSSPASDRYEFIAQIAQGGNGVIYKAMDRNLEREVVIKMIRNTALPTDIARQWFTREAKTAAKLNHPNIVTIYDQGELDGQPFISMELVDGETLVDLIERTELPMQLPNLVAVYEPLCSALAYAHAKGFVHRDIKLENVMITREGEVKLMDFGLAQAMNSPDNDEMVTGTPLYMSPEQIEGGELDHRSDIYSLGIMLFLLACGNWPFDRDNVLHHHRVTPPPDPLSLNPALPPGFRPVIAKSLAKKPADRYANAKELARDLRGLLS